MFKKIKEKYSFVKSNFFHKKQEELLDDLNELYNSKITIVKCCKECDNFVNNICTKYNENLDNPDIIPNWCQRTNFKDLMELIDEIKNENYIKAHFKVNK